MDRKTAIAIACAALVAGCHVTSRLDATVYGKTSYKLHREQRLVLAPRVEVTPAGWFRFVRPVTCKRDILVEQLNYRTTVVKPNLATVIIGVLATTAGGVALLSALGDDSAVLLGGGLVGVGAGLPLAIGPFVGTKRERELVNTEQSKRGRDYKRCGSQSVGAGRAVLRYGTITVRGQVDGDGRFSVRPYELFDAFALHELPAVELSVRAGDQTIRSMLSPSDLAAGRDGFFKASNLDARKPKLSRVPQPRIERITVTRVRRDAVEVRIKVRNTGIGDAWGVRGIVTASNPEVDGRVLYIGHLPAGASRTAATIAELSSDKDLADMRVSVLLRDHHRTTRRVPIKFHGPILNAM